MRSWRTHLPGPRADALLPQARLAGPMPWVIAIMVTLTVIAVAGGLALSNIVQQARSDLAGGLTVQIVNADPVGRAREAEAARRALVTDPAVRSVRAIPQAEIEALLEPWLGDHVGEQGVPVPAMIDVRLNTDASPEQLAQLRASLAPIAPSARIDAQSSWLRPVFSAIVSLRLAALVLVILLAASGAAAVVLAVRSALGANRDTIEIVHLLGGNDRQIARLFQRSVGVDALLGGMAGLALGSGAVLLLGRRFGELQSGLVSGGGLSLSDWIVIASVPLIGLALALMTARVTVLRGLGRVL
ncbi:MAG: cell division protein [Citromicrobium sp.]|nr:MAG: cell division protein [Citromicrobium sp.]